MATSLHEMQPSEDRARLANAAFDDAVRGVLRDWIENGTGPSQDANPHADNDAYVQTHALRAFFTRHDDALERLLANEEIARHLLRPIEEVHFPNATYEPMLSDFETRIYNMEATREHRQIPFRYNPPNRQSEHGASIPHANMPSGTKEDIGAYFGSRRSDVKALDLIAKKLRAAASPSTVPAHIVTEGYMQESLHAVKAATERMQQEGVRGPQVFLIHRRHAEDDRHLGAALLVMDPAQPDVPRRIVFSDTLTLAGHHDWLRKFKQKVDAAFPAAPGEAPHSAQVEDVSVSLQRLHDNVPKADQDIDCAFYTESMLQALLKVMRKQPDLVVQSRDSHALLGAMTGQMPDYFDAPHQPKPPALVREESIRRRWASGTEAMLEVLRVREAVPEAIQAAQPEAKDRTEPMAVEAMSGYWSFQPAPERAAGWAVQAPQPQSFKPQALLARKAAAPGPVLQ